MRVLYIATGFLPYQFSENICNAKLVYAFIQAGWEVDVISSKDGGALYSSEWHDPWLPLEEFTHEISYSNAGGISRVLDTLKSSISLGVYPIAGIRWARRALHKAIELHRETPFDCVLTRSPSDIPHLVGYHFKKLTGVKWIANWNDPACHIWPEPYSKHYPIWKKYILSHCVKKCLQAADINTFPSIHLKHCFEKHYPFLKKQKHEIIPHVAAPQSIVDNVLPDKGEYMWMCHAGNLSVERNPDLIFRAMRELIDEGYDKIRLDIMGVINGFTKPLIVKYNLEGIVRCIGGLPFAQAIQSMGSYNVLVLLEATMDHGYYFPSKLADYIQLNKPILSLSPTSGFVHDMVEKYGRIMAVDNTDYGSIKAAILELYNSWQAGDMNEKYSTIKIYDYISAPSVVATYKKLISE